MGTTPETTPTTRHDWTVDEALALMELPLPDLVFRAASVHRQHHDPLRVQKATLLSIKTGGCPENCSYCPQSAHFKTGVDRVALMPVETVLDAAREAQADGATRFCMGAAWREVREGADFDRVIDMVRGVTDLGMEACVTLGMIKPEQARRLKDAGLVSYNHNLDTSEGHYAEIITTRTYQDRLQTLEAVQDAGISVCSGGILGMGESWRDRAEMLVTLANLRPHPGSVPLNVLVPVEGTPLADAAPLDPFELIRAIATARILMPLSRVRLSAGRLQLSREAQALAFLAGANSIFAGDRLLTTPNPEVDEDGRLLRDLGMQAETCEETAREACMRHETPVAAGA